MVSFSSRTWVCRLFDGALIIIAAILLNIFWNLFTVPTLNECRIPGQEWQPCSSLRVYYGQSALEARFQYDVPLLYAQSFRMVANDCIESISVNGRAIESDALPHCHFKNAAVVDLSHLSRGENTIEVRIRNHSGALEIGWHTAFADARILSVFALLLLLFGFFGWQITRFCHGCMHWRVVHIAMCLLCVIGVVLRILYVANTHFDIRGHDTAAHIDYIEHVVEHWSIPATANGWQFYQPPLYYFVSAGMIAIGSLLGYTTTATLFIVQYASLLYSILTLCIMVWIASMLFDTQKEKWLQVLFVGFLALQPVHVFFAGRINNDVLVHLFSLFALALLLRWWRYSNPSDWFAGTIVVSLGVLTKSTALLLLPVFFVCSLFKRPWQLWPCLKRMGISLLVVSMLTGWYMVYRVSYDDNRSIVPNTATLAGSLEIENHLSTLLIFNPMEVVLHPYNDPFGVDSRRNYFWEYLFKSSLFGEFSFHESLRSLSSVLMFLWLLLLLPFGIGLSKPQYRDLPLLITIGVLLLGHVLYRQMEPFSTSQDFRYSIVVLIPWVYYVVRGIERLPPRLRFLGWVVSLLYLVLSSIFIVLLTLG